MQPHSSSSFKGIRFQGVWSGKSFSFASLIGCLLLTHVKATQFITLRAHACVWCVVCVVYAVCGACGVCGVCGVWCVVFGVHYEDKLSEFYAKIYHLRYGSYMCQQ